MYALWYDSSPTWYPLALSESPQRLGKSEHLTTVSATDYGDYTCHVQCLTLRKRRGVCSGLIYFFRQVSPGSGSYSINLRPPSPTRRPKNEQPPEQHRPHLH